MLGIEAREWKTSKKILICRLLQKQKDDAKRMTVVEVKMRGVVVGGWRM